MSRAEDACLMLMTTRGPKLAQVADVNVDRSLVINVVASSKAHNFHSTENQDPDSL